MQADVRAVLAGLTLTLTLTLTQTLTLTVTLTRTLTVSPSPAQAVLQTDSFGHTLRDRRAQALLDKG